MPQEDIRDAQRYFTLLQQEWGAALYESFSRPRTEKTFPVGFLYVPGSPIIGNSLSFQTEEGQIQNQESLSFLQRLSENIELEDGGDLKNAGNTEVYLRGMVSGSHYQTGSALFRKFEKNKTFQRRFKASTDRSVIFEFGPADGPVTIKILSHAGKIAGYLAAELAEPFRLSLRENMKAAGYEDKVQEIFGGDFTRAENLDKWIRPLWEKYNETRIVFWLFGLTSGNLQGAALKGFLFNVWSYMRPKDKKNGRPADLFFMDVAHPQSPQIFNKRYNHPAVNLFCYNSLYWAGLLTGVEAGLNLRGFDLIIKSESGLTGVDRYFECTENQTWKILDKSKADQELQWKYITINRGERINLTLPSAPFDVDKFKKTAAEVNLEIIPEASASTLAHSILCMKARRIYSPDDLRGPR